MSSTPHHEIRPSDEQYSAIASAYTTSTIHAQGPDLQRMVETVGLVSEAHVLDVGTGTGHTGLAFAAHGASVVGLDLTREMLKEARSLAVSRGAAFTPVQGLAEQLPFVNGTFDVVACRYCAHHFINIPLSIREMRRVLRPNGVLVFVDHVAPERDDADDFINRLDWLRDPSHRREPRLSEYETWFRDAGLHIDSVEHRRELIVTDDWFQRARTLSEREAEARAMLASASDDLRELFAISDDPVSFELHVVLIRAAAR